MHNTTALPMEVALQSGMGLVLELQPLGVLPPQGSMWLPVLAAQAGMMCVRPAPSPAALAAAAAGFSASPPQPGRQVEAPTGVLYAGGRLSPQPSAPDLRAPSLAGSRPHSHDWCPALPLQQLLGRAEGSGHGQRHTVTCMPLARDRAPFLLCVGALPSGGLLSSMALPAS